MNEKVEKQSSPKDVNPNLQDLRDLPPEKRKEIATAGGKASGEARRVKKTFKAIVAEILNFTPPEKIVEQIAGTFPEMPVEEIDNKLALVYSQYAKALKGDTKSFQVLYDISGEKQLEEEEVNNEPLEIRIVE